MIDFEEFKERVAFRFDPDYLVDLLEITSGELLDVFENRLLEKRGEFPEVEDLDEQDNN
jgi:hypothetical protein